MEHLEGLSFFAAGFIAMAAILEFRQGNIGWGFTFLGLMFLNLYFAIS